jgi:hypothetical protein
MRAAELREAMAVRFDVMAIKLKIVKWSFNSINRDPNLLPFKARTYIASHCVLIALIIIWTTGFLHKLSACGIVLAVFGAGVLYWETVAEEQDLKSVGHGIAWYRITKLSNEEIFWITALCHLAFVLFYFYSGLLVSIARYDPNHLKLPIVLCIGILFIFFTSVILLAYVSNKMKRRLCNRWFERLERLRVSQKDAEWMAEIRHLLRLIGFASLWLAGIAQLPATLFSPT